MPDVLIRGIDEEVLDALKDRAKSNGRSLQVELKTILDQAAQMRMIDSRSLAAKIRRSLKHGKHSDSAALLAEDRHR